MLFQEYLKKEIFEIVKKLLDEKNLDSDFLEKNSFNVELSQKVNFGDLSSNVALVFSKFFKTSPEKLAELISIELRKNKYVLKSAELNKEKTTKKLTGFVSLFIVLLKLINKVNINKAIPIGNIGIKMDKFVEFPTKEFSD